MKIYFAQAGEGGPIKIGVTGDVTRRLAALRTGCPAPIRLMDAIDGTPAQEKYLHRKFVGARLNGEWFSPVDHLLSFIGSASTFSWPDDLKAPLGPGFRDFSNIKNIIRSCGGAASIAIASAGSISRDAVYKWRKIGCPWWHWNTLSKLSGVSVEEVFAANELVRARAAA